MNKYRSSKIIIRRSKRVGRGYGSGKGGHTTGRGQKGQKARRKIGVIFEGYKVKKSIIKRLPLRRGRGKFSPHSKPIIIKTSLLNLLPQDSTVDIQFLVKMGIVNKRDADLFGVKILGDGSVEKKLKIAVPISHSAAKLIEKAGGEMLNLNQVSTVQAKK